MRGVLATLICTDRINSNPFNGRSGIVFYTAVSRIPPKSNCMRDRINALFLPPSFLVPNAVQRPVMS